MDLGNTSPILDENAPISLSNEISDIMRSFGDNPKPIPESIKLIERIMRKELRGIFHEASVISLRRKKTPCPTQADFEFLMRCHPIKIARMRKHLKDMRILKKFLSIRTGRPDIMEEVVTLDHDSDDELQYDLPDMFDEERVRRLYRADRISQLLTGEQYLDFNEARKTSFYCRHGEKIKNKFRRFLDLPSEIPISTTTLNILAYFAHETVAVIVDYAILTRLNSGNRITDPHSRMPSAATSASMMHLCPEVTQGRGSEVGNCITIAEIQEGIRRFHQMSAKKKGHHRNACDFTTHSLFLAL